MTRKITVEMTDAEARCILKALQSYLYYGDDEEQVGVFGHPNRTRCAERVEKRIYDAIEAKQARSQQPVAESMSERP